MIFLSCRSAAGQHDNTRCFTRADDDAFVDEYDIMRMRGYATY